ncbi:MULTISPECIES: 50S ribosomal protein L29 [Proteiniphilum]|jgi:large subunit ribosomal protein L29|uniref:50S ribosomal protein L29 n=1 Tax=Proteiniphilum TaxID=294702 RepID=UPI001EEB91B4|nr:MULTISPECIES: 50S ribosomal protein L29 [Proteiniphilum]MDD2245763.1 50S ribosomal protein L29 [Proteiniphilum sp.]MDD3908561.1 50S ribosomal protein L29 [Proteiniphilum sp.]MDD4415303.1 50S ribosomal protein L29 [Proteiniphilum sp.]ULB34228.1 50S ribosomal protein L29 [Proteiniphilum propionicum]
MRKQEELIELSGKDLKERLDAEMIALTRMRINHSITPLDNSGLLKEKRRDIARINTELRARELKKEQ